MSCIDIFKIEPQQPWSSENYLRPDDPLGELTPFDLGLRRFCYDQNQRVSIQVGDEQLLVLLFPDISLLIDWLPGKLADLAHGRPTQWEFPESMVNLEFAPAENCVICTVQRFGLTSESKRFGLDLRSVLDALYQFVDKMLTTAVQAEYITPDDGARFLASIDSSRFVGGQSGQNI